MFSLLILSPAQDAVAATEEPEISQGASAARGSKGQQQLLGLGLSAHSADLDAGPRKTCSGDCSLQLLAARRCCRAASASSAIADFMSSAAAIPDSAGNNMGCESCTIRFYTLSGRKICPECR